MDRLPTGSLSSVARKRLLKELQEWLSGEPVPGMSVEPPERLDLYADLEIWPKLTCLGGM